MAKASGETEPAFVADAMLARLARWLRVLGFDTLYEPAIDDHELVRLADREGRLLLTCDRHLIVHLRPWRGVLLRSCPPLTQLRDLATDVDLGLPRELFTRCLICNARLRAASADEVETLVPKQSRTLEGPFLRCPQCGRVYWPGTHVRRMRAALAREFPEHYGNSRPDR